MALPVRKNRNPKRELTTDKETTILFIPFRVSLKLSQLTFNQFRGSIHSEPKISYS